MTRRYNIYLGTANNPKGWEPIDSFKTDIEAIDYGISVYGEHNFIVTSALINEFDGEMRETIIYK